MQQKIESNLDFLYMEQFVSNGSEFLPLSLIMKSSKHGEEGE